MEGRLWRDGIDIDRVLDEPAFVLVGLLFSYMVDDLANGERSRLEARRIGQYLAEHRRMPEPADLLADVGEQEPVGYQPPDPDTWGLLPEHQAGLMAAVGATGGTTQAPAMDSSAPGFDTWEAAPLRG